MPRMDRIKDMDRHSIHLYLLHTVVHRQDNSVLNVAQPNKIPVENFVHPVVNRITDRYVDNQSYYSENICVLK